MIKYFLISIIAAISVCYAQTNVELLSNLNGHASDGYNDIWGYVDGSGNEYALLGVRSGTSIINLADPQNPVEVAFIPGTYSVWRDIKTWGTYAYVVSDNTADGLQIIDLSQLPVTATLVNQINTWFDRAHNIYIDNGYAYVVGTEGGGGMHILDLSIPTNPTRTAYYTGSDYVHDVYVWNDTVVACVEDTYDLVDVTDKSNPQLISSSAAIPGIYAHSGWMTEDKRYFYATEEFNQVDITVWDLQDRSTWNLVIPSWQTQSNATVHNLYIKGNYAHISYYSNGYVVLDITNPENPFQVGEYITPDMWGCYPFLPSGITICSDIINGLYVFQFNSGAISPVISHNPINEVYNEDPVTITANINDDGTIAEANLRYRTTINGTTSGWNLVTDQNGPTANLYEFIIPGEPDNTIVEYYISAQDNDDNVSTLPQGGSGTNPPGSIPPPTFLDYEVKIPGTPIILDITPDGDTTIAPNGHVGFLVSAQDTSGFNLTYKWWKNSSQLSVVGNSYLYFSNPGLPYPRVDTIRVQITNGFFYNGNTWLVSVEDASGVNNEISDLTYSLSQNYPNPFNPVTTINFSIPEQEIVNISIYNLLGEKVTELVNKTMPAGEYKINFNAEDLPSGIYLAKISAGSYNQIIKMSLLK